MWSVGDRCWSWLWERFLSNKFSLNRHCGKVKDVKVCHFGSFKFTCSPRMGLWGFKVGLSHCERHPKITRIHVILQVWLDDINVIHYWYWSGHVPDMLTLWAFQKGANSANSGHSTPTVVSPRNRLGDVTLFRSSKSSKDRMLIWSDFFHIFGFVENW